MPVLPQEMSAKKQSSKSIAAVAVQKSTRGFTKNIGKNDAPNLGSTIGFTVKKSATAIVSITGNIGKQF